MPFFDPFLRPSIRRKPLYDAHSVRVLTVSRLKWPEVAWRELSGSFFFFFGVTFLPRDRFWSFLLFGKFCGCIINVLKAFIWLQETNLTIIFVINNHTPATFQIGRGRQ